jgi:hypothetical protein
MNAGFRFYSRPLRRSDGLGRYRSQECRAVVFLLSFVLLARQGVLGMVWWYGVMGRAINQVGSTEKELSFF